MSKPADLFCDACKELLPDWSRDIISVYIICVSCGKVNDNPDEEATPEIDYDQVLSDRLDGGYDDLTPEEATPKEDS